MKGPFKNRWLILVKIISILILLIGVHNLSAQCVIYGKIDASLGIDSFVVAFAKTPAQENSIYSRGEGKVVKVFDGKYRLEISDVPDLFYVIFDFPKIKGVKKPKSIAELSSFPILLSSQGDIEINILEKGNVYNGVNKKLLECQFELFHLNSERSSSLIEQYNSWEFKKQDPDLSIAVLFEIYRSQTRKSEMDAKTLIYQRYNGFSRKVSNRLLYDFIGDIRHSEIRRINFLTRNHQDKAPYAVDLYLKDYLLDVEPDLVEGYLGGSAIFANYLSSKIYLDLYMANFRIDKNIDINLQLILEVISKKYQGKLYDEVAFASYLKTGITKDVDESIFRRLITSIDSFDLREQVQEDQIRKQSRSKSFQFTLFDEGGKKVTNDDLKGKVVLFDFWFTGCSGCSILHQQMIPIKNRYRGNPQVVFASICVDNKEESWKKSLRSGKYTDDMDLKLWVGPGNLDHPMIPYYNIGTYPTMILVGKEDELVMINPPRPTNPLKIRELIYLIDKEVDRESP